MLACMKACNPAISLPDNTAVKPLCDVGVVGGVVVVGTPTFPIPLCYSCYPPLSSSIDLLSLSLLFRCRPSCAFLLLAIILLTSSHLQPMCLSHTHTHTHTHSHVSLRSGERIEQLHCGAGIHDDHCSGER